MKILVTGCAGFIGFHLTKRLLSEGHEVIGVDNLNDYYSPVLKADRLKQLDIDTRRIEESEVLTNADKCFTFIKAGIEDARLYEDFLNAIRFDAVCHLAAQAGVRYSLENPQQYITSNIQGFFNVLEYCRLHPVKRLVFASSSSIYGKNTSVPYRESDKTDSPVSLYAATKKSNELLAHSYCELYGMNAIALRFFTVYGPWGRPDMAPFLFTKAVRSDQPIKVFNNGDMARDFTYIDDIVTGVCKVLLTEQGANSDKSEHFRVYNIGNSKPVNLLDFISTIERLSGKTTNKIFLPMQPGDVKTTWADTTLLYRDYGYSPDTSIEKGIKEFITWYKRYYE